MRSGRSCSSRKSSQKRFQRLEVQVLLLLLQLLIINMAHVRRRDEKEVLARYQDLIKVNMISVIDLVLGAPQNCSPMLATTQSQNLPKKMPPLYLMNTKWFDAPNSSEQEKKFRQFASSWIDLLPFFMFYNPKVCVRVWGESLLIWFWADLRRQFSPSKSYEKTWKSTMTHKSLEKGKVIFYKSEKWELGLRFGNTESNFLEFKWREIRF